VRERHRAAIVLFGAIGSHWGDAKRAIDFFDIKGMVVQLAEKLHIPLDFATSDAEWLRAGKRAVARHKDREIATESPRNRTRAEDPLAWLRDDARERSKRCLVLFACNYRHQVDRRGVCVWGQAQGVRSCHNAPDRHAGVREVVGGCEGGTGTTTAQEQKRHADHGVHRKRTGPATGG